MNNLGKKKIKQLISDNYSLGSVLYFFGISFYNYSEKTLEQVCKEKNLDLRTVIKNLETPQRGLSLSQSVIQQYPIDLIVEYLKHAHYIFIKSKLPYISKLIRSLDQYRADKVSKDLNFVFPYFMEDFIRHVYEEEDTLFKYILTLNSALHQKSNIAKLYYAMERNSINDYALSHSMDDDEMLGVRKLTNNYEIKDPNDLHLNVILQELKDFERELLVHAKIENEILFPKALALENEVSMKFKNWILNN